MLLLNFISVPRRDSSSHNDLSAEYMVSVIIINRLKCLAILIEVAHPIIHPIIVRSYPIVRFNTIPTAHPVSNATSK